MQEFAGRKWTQKVSTAWADALNAVAELMIGGHESAETANATTHEDNTMASRASTKTGSRKEIEALQAEVADLRATAGRFQGAVEQSGTARMMVDRDLVVTYANPATMAC